MFYFVQLRWLFEQITEKMAILSMIVQVLKQKNVFAARFRCLIPNHTN